MLIRYFSLSRKLCGGRVGTARRAVRGRLGEASLPRSLDASALCTAERVLPTYRIKKYRKPKT
jgi:hypothetical protein